MSKEINIEVKRALENTKKELEHAKTEMAKSRQMQLEVRAKAGKGGSVAGARAGGMKTMSDTDYEIMLEKMTKDGLIDREKGFIVAKQNGKLVINGNTQPDEVLNKYKEYLKDKSVTIKGKKGGLTIDVND